MPSSLQMSDGTIINAFSVSAIIVTVTAAAYGSHFGGYVAPNNLSLEHKQDAENIAIVACEYLLIFRIHNWLVYVI